MGSTVEYVVLLAVALGLLAAVIGGLLLVAHYHGCDVDDEVEDGWVDEN